MKRLATFILSITIVFSSFTFTFADDYTKFQATTASEIRTELKQEYKINTCDVDDYTITWIYETIIDMYKVQPELTEYGLQHLNKIYTNHSTQYSKTYALTYYLDGNIQMFGYWFSDEGKNIKDSYVVNTVRTHYHPYSTNFKGVFIHEFMHIIDGAMQKAHKWEGYSPANVVTDAMQDYINDGHSILNAHNWCCKISNYAAVDDMETLAEAWLDTVQNPNCENEAWYVVNSFWEAYCEYELEEEAPQANIYNLTQMAATVID